MKIDKKTAKFSDDTLEFQAMARIDSTIEVEYYRLGSILQMGLRRLMN